MTQEELNKKRRAILLEYMNKPEVLVELKEIKDYLAVFSKRELKYNPDVRLVEAISKLSQILDKIPRIEKNILPTVNVKTPDRINIDWENQPVYPIQKENIKVDWDVGKKKLVPLFNFKTPIIWLSKQVEALLTPLLNKIISLISEPDRTKITRNYFGDIDTITDYYGDRQITYKIMRNNSNEINEVDRNER